MKEALIIIEVTRTDGSKVSKSVRVHGTTTWARMSKKDFAAKVEREAMTAVRATLR